MRRLTSSAQFCCEEHQEQYKKETVSRLLEYREPAPGHGAEDPIHRLGIVSSGLHPETNQDEWQLQAFILPDLRRYAPARAPLLGLIEKMIMRPGIRWTTGLRPVTLTPAGPASKPLAAAETPAARPELAAAIWIDPALLDPGISLRHPPVVLEFGKLLWLKTPPAAGRSVEPRPPASWGRPRSGLGAVETAGGFLPVVAASIPATSAAALSGSVQLVQASTCAVAAPSQSLGFAPLSKAAAPLCHLSATPRTGRALDRLATDWGVWPERREPVPHFPFGPRPREVREVSRSPQTSVRIPSAEPLALPALWPALQEAVGAAGIPCIAERPTPVSELLQLKSALSPAISRGSQWAASLRSECVPAMPNPSALRLSPEPQVAASAVLEPSPRFATAARLRAEMISHPGGGRSPEPGDAPAAAFGPQPMVIRSGLPRLPENSLAPRPVTATPRPARVERLPGPGPAPAQLGPATADLAGWILASPQRRTTEGKPIPVEIPPVTPPPDVAYLPVRSAAQALSNRKSLTPVDPHTVELLEAIPVPAHLGAAEALAIRQIATAPAPRFVATSVKAAQAPGAFLLAAPELYTGRPPEPGVWNPAPQACGSACRPNLAPAPAPMRVGRGVRQSIPPPLPEPERPVRRLPVIELPAVAPAPLLPHGGVHEALEKMQRRRTSSARRFLLEASFFWHDRIRPALAGNRARAAVAVAAALLITALMLRLAGTSVAAKSLTRPLDERSFYLVEDGFRSDLHVWTNPQALVKRDDGMVQVKNGVTLFQPSMKRIDYEFTFSGRIERGSLSWAVRATDAKNFYAFKLAHLGKGKERRSVLLRYPVADGAEADKPRVVALPFELDESHMYQVLVRTSGDRVTTVVEDRGVDSYADSRLKAGGVGFFADEDESSLIQSAAVSGNDDGLGRSIYWLTGFFQYVGSKL